MWALFSVGGDGLDFAAAARSEKSVSGMLIAVVGRTLELSPAELLEAARRGDAAAQSSLFEAQKHRVARQILRMTGDASVVDDLVQEVFVSAFRRLADFRGDAQLETWLYRITVNKVSNWTDARRRRIARERKAAVPVEELRMAAPDEELVAADRMSRFYEALHELPEDYRNAFVARTLENKSLQETSDLLEVPVSTVSYRARRAEELLVQALGLEANG